MRFFIRIIMTLIFIITISSCNNEIDPPAVIPKTITFETTSPKDTYKIINNNGKILSERFAPPKGFKRIFASKNSFAEYLQKFPLKSNGSKVYYFNGQEKTFDYHDAVLDIDTGSKDLQQCADSIIRLRAEYLYNKNKFSDIHFNFVNGFNADFNKWSLGYRISVSNNNTSWYKSTNPAHTYTVFRKYLDMVFNYASTLSLEKELQTINIEDMQIGDIFIKGGSPGHCVIVMDMAESIETGGKAFILAQGFMPAQDMHIIKNLDTPDLSPWYPLGFIDQLELPQWTFSQDSLKRFPD